MAIELVPLCTIDVDLVDQIFVGEGPSGLRVIAEVGTITVTGERLSGRQRGAAHADWLTLVDGIATIDVRMTIETDDGAVVFISYLGRSDFREGPGSTPIFAAPRFETGDERYTWLNTVQAVAKGSFDGNRVSYEVAEVR